MLNLNETQAGVLQPVLRIAGANSLLLDLKDLAGSILGGKR